MFRVLWLLLVMTALRAEEPLRVLFLGNSYTYYNNLPGLVEGMSRAAGGRRIEARAVSRGGATLEQLYTETDALAVLRGARWDVVVLQEQSSLGLNQWNGDAVVNLPDSFFTWARIWDEEIRRQGARTAFLNTWARRGRGELQLYLDWAYATIAKELGAALIPAGTAFQNVTGVELFQSDGSHPSAAGSYAAACVAVAVLSGGGCAEAPARIDGVPVDNATGRLKGEPGAMVDLPEDEAVKLRKASLEAVDRLREAGGYWRLERPPYAGEGQPGAEVGEWAGQWEGVTWLYGKQANVTLQLEWAGGVCSGWWTVSAADPVTETRLPLERCEVSEGQLRFTVTPLFLVAETHTAWIEGGQLQGSVRLASPSRYQRRGGTWTLRKRKS